MLEGMGDETAGAAHFVAGELLVRTETVALQISVGSDNVHRHVGIKLVLLVVPIELLTGCRLCHLADFSRALYHGVPRVFGHTSRLCRQ